MRLPRVLAVVVLLPACHTEHHAEDAQGSDTCAPCVMFAASDEMEESCGCVALPATCPTGCECESLCIEPATGANCGNATTAVCAGSNGTCPDGCEPEMIV